MVHWDRLEGFRPGELHLSPKNPDGGGRSEESIYRGLGSKPLSGVHLWQDREGMGWRSLARRPVSPGVGCRPNPFHLEGQCI